MSVDCIHHRIERAVDSELFINHGFHSRFLVVACGRWASDRKSANEVGIRWEGLVNSAEVIVIAARSNEAGMMEEGVIDRRIVRTRSVAMHRNTTVSACCDRDCTDRVVLTENEGLRCSGTRFFALVQLVVLVLKSTLLSDFGNGGSAGSSVLSWEICFQCIRGCLVELLLVSLKSLEDTVVARVLRACQELHELVLVEIKEIVELLERLHC